MNEEKLIKSIEKIIQLLGSVDSSSYFPQMNFLSYLIDLIALKEYDTFFKKVNGSELWGGSGSVWESEYGFSQYQRKELVGLLLEILIYLKDNNEMEKRARSVYKILSSN